jgi:hypothetical protein
MDRNDVLAIDKHLDDAMATVQEVKDKTKNARETAGYMMVQEQIQRAKFILNDMSK